MSDKTHPWIYVIIPVNTVYYDTGIPINTTMALFSAFCKDCRQYFTEAIPWTGEPMVTPSALPRIGCGEIVADEGFSALPGVDHAPRDN